MLEHFTQDVEINANNLNDLEHPVFSWSDEFWQTLKIAIPMCLAFVGNMAMGIVDTLVVGRVSAVQLAGVAAGNAVFWTSVVISFGLLAGMETLISQAHGRNDLKGADRTLGQGLWLSLVIILLGTPALMGITHFYEYSGAKPEVVEVAKPFLLHLTYSFPFLIVFNVLQRYWQSLEIVLPVTLIVIVANIINYIGNVAFVEGRWGFTAMGAVGSAYATLLCRVLMLIALIAVSVYYWRKRNRSSRGEKFLLRYLRIDVPLFRRLTRIGLPAGGQVAIEVGTFNIGTTLVAGLGAIDLAAHHIVLSIASFTFMFPLGLGSASAVRVGTHMGAGDYNAARRTGWLTLAMGAIFMASCGLALLLFPEAFIGSFTKDQAVIQLAMKVILFAALFQIFDGIQAVGAGALRGIGNTKESLWANLLGHYGVSLPLGLVFCFTLQWGLSGLWLGITSGLIVTAAMIVFFWNKLTVRYGV